MKRTTGIAATAVAAAALGGGAGAGIYAIASPGSTSTTVVRQVAAPSSTAQPTAAATSLTVGQIYNQAHMGVVQINVSGTQTDPFGGTQRSQALGTGFVYDNAGHIVTNDHVVAGASSISVRFWNGASYKATLVGADPSSDLAVIKINAPSSILHPLTLGDSNAVQVGDNVVAIGSPFGLAETVTSGIVSALHRQMTAPNNFTINDSIQTDAAINHGNSGGPLLNSQGQVIGVNSQIQSDSGGNEGVGFAVPSKTVSTIATQLIASGKAQHAYLGISVNSATGAGVKVGLVRTGTPAEAAGLKAGDVITSIAGTPVHTVAALQEAVDAKKPGDTITVVYTRNGSSHTVQVKLTTRPA